MALRCGIYLVESLVNMVAELRIRGRQHHGDELANWPSTTLGPIACLRTMLARLDGSSLSVVTDSRDCAPGVAGNMPRPHCEDRRRVQVGHGGPAGLHSPWGD